MERKPIEFSGVVLAAGRSSRMGRDKALLECEGVPMWRRQREVLRAAGAREIFLSARDDQMWLPTATGFDAVLFDGVSVGGPIVGVTAAVERASSGHVAVLAIDLPRMHAGWLKTLAQACAPGIGCAGRRGDFFEPLAAIYPTELRWLAWEALVAGEYSLQRLLARAVEQGLMCGREITQDEAPLFENWNEPK
jgi:molybdopterin-guanine dinucleotide biosynthesis protein A